MQQGERPVAVGLYFSLGHAAVVALMSLAVGFAAAGDCGVRGPQGVGGVVSTSASALFLFLLAAFNIVVLISVWRTFQAVKRGEPFSQDDFDLLLNSRGLLARLFRPAVPAGDARAGICFPIGFLFGLGFDTATEVALFGIVGDASRQRRVVRTLLVFPALFTAGMTLIDTTDGVLMLGAYGWAFMKPIRKLYYNIDITAVSVVVAIADRRHRDARPHRRGRSSWRARSGTRSGRSTTISACLVTSSSASLWRAGSLSVLIYRAKGYDSIEVRA